MLAACHQLQLQAIIFNPVNAGSYELFGKTTSILNHHVLNGFGFALASMTEVELDLVARFLLYHRE